MAKQLSEKDIDLRIYSGMCQRWIAFVVIAPVTIDMYDLVGELHRVSECTRTIKATNYVKRITQTHQIQFFRRVIYAPRPKDLLCVCVPPPPTTKTSLPEETQSQRWIQITTCIDWFQSSNSKRLRKSMI